MRNQLNQALIILQPKPTKKDPGIAIKWYLRRATRASKIIETTSPIIY
jgi:hypothetical protein